MCLVYPMVPVSLDCLCSVCLRLLSCVPNGSSFSRLSLFCLSSSCVLCTQWCQFLLIVFVLFVFVMCLVYPMVLVSLDCLCSVCLRHVSCAPNGSSFFRLSLFCLSSSSVLCTQWYQFLLIVFVLFFFVLCLVYPISVEWWNTRWNYHNCRRNRSYLFAYDAFCFVFLRLVSCVPNGTNFSWLSLFCLSSSCVLCTQWFQFL